MARFYTDREKAAVKDVREDLHETGLPGLVAFLNGASWPHPEPGYLDDLRETVRTDVRAWICGTYREGSFGVQITLTARALRDRAGRYRVTFDVAGGDLEWCYWVFYQAIQTGMLDKLTECPACGTFTLSQRRSRKYCSDRCRDQHKRTNNRERQRRHHALSTASAARAR